MQTIDITQVMTAFKWSGSVSQAARTLELSVLHAPYDENIKALDLRLSIGDFIILQEEKEKKEIFFGEIQTIEKQSENGELTYYCIDLLNHLLKKMICLYVTAAQMTGCLLHIKAMFIPAALMAKTCIK